MYYRSHCCETTILSADTSDGLNNDKTIFELLLNDIFKGVEPNKKKLFQNVFKTLSKGIHKGYGKTIATVQYNSPDFRILNELTYNVGVFSAFKNHSKINELVKALKNEDGTLRKFNEFKTEAEKIIGKYNEHYLRVEYNQAITSARASRKWQDIIKTKHLYPNLIYKAIQDERTRQSHKQWHGITLPIDHLFWNTHYPPNDWNCRCSVSRTDKAIDAKGYDVDNIAELPKQFNNNVGKTGKVFNEKHPYFKTDNYKQVASFANSALINFGRKEVKDYFKKNKLTGVSFSSAIGSVTINNKALDHIVSTYHEKAYLRNNLMYDIKSVLKDAKFVKTALDTKKNPMVKQYHYLKVKIGADDFFLNVRELVNGDLILYAITQKIQ